MAAKRKKPVQKVTVSELQSYIKGAIEFNPDDWHPDKPQWDKIVEMIMNIKKDDVKTVEKVVEIKSQTGSPVPARRVQGSSMDVPPASSGNTEFQPPVERPVKEEVRATDAPKLQVQKTMVDPSDRDENGVPKSGISIKTPNVDTSEQPYESGFT